jgi:hypothetical protein
MSTDLYTKILLTIIAISTSVVAFTMVQSGGGSGLSSSGELLTFPCRFADRSGECLVPLMEGMPINPNG